MTPQHDMIELDHDRACPVPTKSGAPAQSRAEQQLQHRLITCSSISWRLEKASGLLLPEEFSFDGQMSESQGFMMSG